MNKIYVGKVPHTIQEIIDYELIPDTPIYEVLAIVNEEIQGYRTKLEEEEDRIIELEDEVEALETEVEMLNDMINTIKEVVE